MPLVTALINHPFYKKDKSRGKRRLWRAVFFFCNIYSSPIDDELNCMYNSGKGRPGECVPGRMPEPLHGV